MGQPGVEQSQTLSTQRLLYPSVENDKKIILRWKHLLYYKMESSCCFDDVLLVGDALDFFEFVKNLEILG
jgi:hypothetical protein